MGRRRAFDPGLVLDEAPKTPAPKRRAQLAERLRLDLTDALARYVEALTDLFQGVLALFTDSKPQAQDLGFLLGETGQGALHLGGEVVRQERLHRRGCPLVLQEIPEIGVFPDRRLQR